MKKRIFALFTCAFLLAVTVLPVAASANSAAPDPVVTVKLKNLPDGEYELALIDDQHKRFAGGESAPASNGMPVYHFHGYGMPRDFSISLIDADGVQNRSEPFHRDAYYTTIVYDCAQNRIVYATPVWLAYLIQFLCTCIPTLLIEGVILLLFRFDWRKNWKVFLLLNLVTQVFLTWCMAGQYIGNGDRGYPFMMMILAEVPIFIAEAIVCAMKLKGHTRGRRAAYALCANAVSLAFGLWANPYIFRLLQQI